MQPNSKSVLRTRSDRGFTLVELLVVIVILGALAGVVVFAVNGISDRGQASACAEDARTLRTAEESQFAKTGAYATQAGLVTAGLLSQASTLHDVTLSASTYTITDAGVCSSSGSGSTPLPVTGANAWLDASDASTVALSSGSPQYVTQWTDKSGNSTSSVTNASNSSSITYSNSAINGHPAVVTTGSAILSNATAYGPSSTVFVVAKMTGALTR